MPKIAPTSEWSEAITKHIEKLKTEEERFEFAHNMIFDIATWTGCNSYETIGILEHVKMELFASIREFNDNKEYDDELP